MEAKFQKTHRNFLPHAILGTRLFSSNSSTFNGWFPRFSRTLVYSLSGAFPNDNARAVVLSLDKFAIATAIRLCTISLQGDSFYLPSSTHLFTISFSPLSLLSLSLFFTESLFTNSSITFITLSSSTFIFLL